MVRRKTAVGALLSVVVLLLTAVPAHAAAPPTPLGLSVNGANGTGTSAVGVACGSGGQGDSWSYTYSATANPPAFTQTLPVTVGLNLDLHSDSGHTSAFLGPNTTVTLTNTRGTVTLGLTSGSCGQPTLAFNGTVASGSGSWQVTGGTGAYRSTTGSGTFTLMAQVAAGTTNPFSLALLGTLSVLQPSLSVPAASARWANPSDLFARRLTVTYTVKNNGPGDAFGVSVVSVTPVTSGVTVLSSTPIAVGDIAAGASRQVSVVYHLKVANPPCTAYIAVCTVQATLTLRVPDSLDVPVAPNPAFTVSASPLI